MLKENAMLSRILKKNSRIPALLVGLAILCILVEFIDFLRVYSHIYGDRWLEFIYMRGMDEVIIYSLLILVFSVAALIRVWPSLAYYRHFTFVAAFTISLIALILNIMGFFRGGPLLIIVAPALLFAAVCVESSSMSRFRKKTSRNNKQGVASINAGFSLFADETKNALCFAIRGSGIGIRAWAGLCFGAVFFGGILAFGIGLMAAATSGPAGVQAVFNLWLTLTIFAFICFFVWMLIRRREFTFDITDSDIQLGGKHYAKQNISEILLRNKGTTLYHAQKTGSSTQSSTIVVGTGVIGGGLMAANSVGRIAEGIGQIGREAGQTSINAIKKSIAMRNYQVCIRHGRKVIPLAKYLKEDDAIALYNKVAEVL